MTTPPAERRVDQAIQALVDGGREFSSTDLAERLGVTRQAVHRHLARRLADGSLTSVGRARATRYRCPDTRSRPAMTRTGSPYASPEGVPSASLVREDPESIDPTPRWTFSTQALDESAAWARVWAESPSARSAASPYADKILTYAFSELINNAIDHSQADRVQVGLELTAPTRTLHGVVCDLGLGAFESVRSHLQLETVFEAAQELSKGKVTRDPARHSGEGLFFLSKAADRFALEANGLAWIVDNQRGDQTLRSIPTGPGTRAHLQLSATTQRSLTALFDEFSTEYTFDRTRIALQLFEYGIEFVSRSEAKRLARNLDRFREVLLDFRGVESVGQGFVDELFRVWSAAHPDIRLIPQNMVPAVEFMIRRGLGPATPTAPPPDR